MNTFEHDVHLNERKKKHSEVNLDNKYMKKNLTS